VGDEIRRPGAERRARLQGVGLTYGALSLLLLGLYFFLARVLLPLVGLHGSIVAHGAALIGVAALAFPLRLGLGRVVSRITRRERQEAQDLQREVAAELSRTIESNGLHALLVETLPRRLRLQGAALWMLEPPDDYALVAIGWDPASLGATLLANGATAMQMRYASGALHVPQHSDSEWPALLLAIGVRLAIPLRIGDKLVGIYGVGLPLGRAEYPPYVMDVLLTLAPTIASAVQNARAYTEIAHLNNHLRALDQLKDEFIESVGHELRTPLTSLTLALQLLSNRPEMARDMGQVLRGSVDRLERVVDRVLRLDRERQHTPSREEMAISAVELLPLLESILAEYAPPAAFKGLELRLEVAPGLAVWGDSAYVRRAVHEVVDNAVRYSDHGAILVRAEVRDGLALVNVIDQGPGIPPDECDHLFDEFFRGRSGRALAERPGMGLGLSLARRDLEALGGQLWLERTGPEGSTMCVALPAILLAQSEFGAPRAGEAEPPAQAVYTRLQLP
jgi:signal transduction histidine kinase